MLVTRSLEEEDQCAAGEIPPTGLPNPAISGEGCLRRDGFTIGEWTVEPRRLRIVSCDRVRSLDPRLIDVLVALAQCPGQVRTRDELLSTVWNGTFVHENSLSQAISRLRKALGDDRHAPRYIETISRSGYRLIAQVHRSQGSPGSPEPSSAADGGEEDRPESAVRSDGTMNVTIPPVRWRWQSWSIAAALLVLALVLGFDRRAQPPLPTSASIPRIRPEVTLPGSQFGPRLSPNGEYVAFAWQSGESESWDIWIQAIGGENPVRIADHADHERLPTWSPDGQRLAFVRFSSDSSRCGLFSMQILGGPAERLGDCRRGLRSLAWSPDGKTLAFDGFMAEDPAPEDPGPKALFLLDLARGKSRRLTSPPQDVLGDTNARFSPDGAWLAFEREIGAYRHDVAVISLSTGETRRLTEDRWGQVRGLDWTSDSAAVLFSSNRAGRFALWKAPLSGGAPELLPIHDDWVTQPSVSRSGGRLIYRAFRDSVDIWELPLSVEGMPSGEPMRRVPSSRSESQPAWSPDSGSMAFVSDRSGAAELWSGRGDGAEMMRHTDLGGPHPGSPAWSPDGQLILFDAAVEGHADLWVVDRQSRLPKRLIQERSNDRNGSFSRDGSRIYFASDRQGAWDIWCMSAAGGDAWPVTSEGGFFAQESFDGDHLYYVRLEEPGIWRVPTAGGASERVSSGLDLSDWGSWVLAEQGIYYLRRQPTAIYFLAYNGSEDRLVYQPSKQMPFLVRALSLSSDGRSLLFAMIDHSDDEIMTVDLEGI